jgi:hypothetical protein
MSDSKQKSSYEHGSDFERLRSYGNFLIPVHALMWTALCALQALLLPADSPTQLQRAARAIHNRAAACVAAGGGIFEKSYLSTDKFKLKVISRS